LITENFSTGLEHLAAAAHARGVDQRVAASIALEVEVDRIARRAGLVERDHPLLAEERVDERRLADVGPTDDRDLDRVVVRGFGVLRSERARATARARRARRRFPPCAEDTGCGSPRPSS
jgi:hypothetical protein